LITLIITSKAAFIAVSPKARAPYISANKNVPTLEVFTKDSTKAKTDTSNQTNTTILDVSKRGRKTGLAV
jgi:hypothetical protein